VLVVGDLRAGMDSNSVEGGKEISLAEAFRAYMTDGQTMVKPNPQRQRFFSNVVERAKTVCPPVISPESPISFSAIIAS